MWLDRGPSRKAAHSLYLKALAAEDLSKASILLGTTDVTHPNNWLWATGAFIAVERGTFSSFSFLNKGSTEGCNDCPGPRFHMNTESSLRGLSGPGPQMALPSTHHSSGHWPCQTQLHLPAQTRGHSFPCPTRCQCPELLTPSLDWTVFWDRAGDMVTSQ